MGLESQAKEPELIAVGSEGQGSGWRLDWDTHWDIWITLGEGAEASAIPQELVPLRPVCPQIHPPTKPWEVQAPSAQITLYLTASPSLHIRSYLILTIAVIVPFHTWEE